MALNSTQNNQVTAVVAKFLAAVSKAIAEFGQKEDLVLAIAVVCTLAIMAGVVLMNTAVMISALAVLILAFTPTILRWAKSDPTNL